MDPLKREAVTKSHAEAMAATDKAIAACEDPDNENWRDAVLEAIPLMRKFENDALAALLSATQVELPVRSPRPWWKFWGRK